MKDQSIKPIEQITNGNVNVRTGDLEETAKRWIEYRSDNEMCVFTRAGVKAMLKEWADIRTASLQQRVKELEDCLRGVKKFAQECDYLSAGTKFNSIANTIDRLLTPKP